MTTAALWALAAGAGAFGLVFAFVKFNDWVGREIDRISTEEIREERGPYGEG
jgi:4-hydroxybenzoate polyprenyltransferase